MSEKKCTTETIETCRKLLEKNIDWYKIAELVGVHRNSLANWRDPKSDHYVTKFAEMVTEAEEISADKTKAGQKEQSVKHTIKRTIVELRVVDSRSLGKKAKAKFPEMAAPDKKEKAKFPELTPPPDMPPSWFPKAYIIDYADQVLDLILYPRMSINVMRAECLLRIKELTVTVKAKAVSEQEVDPNPNAVKLVLKNTGKDENRWRVDEEVKVGTDDPLSALLAQIGGIKRGLPDGSKIPEYATKKPDDEG